MKIKTPKLIAIALSGAVLISAFSCGEDEYPVYSLKEMRHVPDSLQRIRQQWMIDMIEKTSSSSVSISRYKDAAAMADNLFGIRVIGLRKEINDQSEYDIDLLPIEMTEHERHVLDSLRNN